MPIFEITVTRMVAQPLCEEELADILELLAHLPMGSNCDDKNPHNERQVEEAARHPHISPRPHHKVSSDLPNVEECRRVADLLKASSNATRLVILLFLMDTGEQSVGDIVAEVEESQPNVSHHLRVLRDAGLVQNQRDGQFERYQLTDLGFDLAQITSNLADDDLS